MSQDDAVVLFHNQVLETPADSTRKDIMQPSGSYPEIKLLNPALKNLTGINIQIDKLSLSVEFPELFSEMPDLEAPVFLVKT